jgi:ABC-type phosphate transport system substrate-binding protein
MRRSLPLLALLTALAAGTAPAPARANDQPFLVVVHPGTPVTELSRTQLSRLFLKKSTQWNDGSAVRPVEPLAPALRQAFARQVHDRTLADLAAYWNALIFSGRELPPLEKASDADLVAYVRATPGAIGYVTASADLTGVKVVGVGKAP